ncbi:hypothetical protein IT417_00435, partial [bacterium]|nr:hypothetical protein [bacterium]
MEKKQNRLEKELSSLAKYLSGESDLREKQAEVEKLKKAAIEKQKNIRREEIKDGKVVLEKEEEEKKVVQKINLFEWESPIRFKFPLDMKTYTTVV